MAAQAAVTPDSFRKFILDNDPVSVAQIFAHVGEESARAMSLETGWMVAEDEQPRNQIRLSAPKLRNLVSSLILTSPERSTNVQSEVYGDVAFGTVNRLVRGAKTYPETAPLMIEQLMTRTAERESSQFAFNGLINISTANETGDRRSASVAQYAQYAFVVGALTADAGETPMEVGSEGARFTDEAVIRVNRIQAVRNDVAILFALAGDNKQIQREIASSIYYLSQDGAIEEDDLTAIRSYLDFKNIQVGQYGDTIKALIPESRAVEVISINEKNVLVDMPAVLERAHRVKIENAIHDVLIELGNTIDEVQV
ncbi:MAG: hypothetical protein K8I00_00420, partial [Candidatus Omnitrophica bacterium]|nr:hypothetical protein [Candidatus Omnitrophota bacterium]